MNISRIKKITNYLFSPRFYVSRLIARQSLSKYIPDKTYLKLWYYANTGRKLNLNNPQTYNEKLQWLKLYDRNPIYTTMVDKLAVKQYVSDMIGEEYVIPTLGIWDKVDDIDWNVLPNQFVLKCTHDSGGIVICHDKSLLNIEKAKEKLDKALHSNYYSLGREWPYKDVPRRIIAEMYLTPSPGMDDLPDYKFFCFNGEVKALFIATDRHRVGEDVKFDFFDSDFIPLKLRQGHDHAKITPLKPHNFDLMKRLASSLSKGIPHVRVDFYEVGNRVYFGELTFFHFCGIIPFEPEEWDSIFGSWIKLPK